MCTVQYIPYSTYEYVLPVHFCILYECTYPPDDLFFRRFCAFNSREQTLKLPSVSFPRIVCTTFVYVRTYINSNIKSKASERHDAFKLRTFAIQTQEKKTIFHAEIWLHALARTYKDRLTALRYCFCTTVCTVLCAPLLPRNVSS